MLVKIPTDHIAEQHVLHAHSLEEMGCSTENCDGKVTHLALVEIKLIDGRQLSITKPYCAMCMMAVQAIGQA